MALGLQIPGSGNLASASIAKSKADTLSDILQFYFQARDYNYNGSDIGDAEVMKAIAYARSKKQTKEYRKAVIGTTQFTLGVAAITGGVTIGSVAPGIGNVAGGMLGFVGSQSLGIGVSGLDRVKRGAKRIYKEVRGTAGKHREQAAIALWLHEKDGSTAGEAAFDALEIIMGDRFEKLMANNYSNPVKAIADRLKSN